MPCYIEKPTPPSRTEYESWKNRGYNRSWEDYCKSKKSAGDTPWFLCGDLGEHCHDCSGVGDFLCDFPVGDGKTCDRPMCGDHSHEIGPNLHYCETHFQMWQQFKADGGVDKALSNVIPFRKG